MAPFVFVHALSALLLAALPAPPAFAQSPAVWCHDVKRSLVTRKSAAGCEGRVVSDEEAERIKQRRVERIKRVLQREREPILPGRRLSGTGTGFIVSLQGEVVTNHHVIDGCGAVTVNPAGADEMVARVRAADPRRDLALLETDRRWPGAARLRGHDEVLAQEPVTVVGYPLHGKVVIKPVLVTGQVQGEEQGIRTGPHVFPMKIDVRRGNSGGPVLDRAGEVIGVVFAKVDTPAIFARTGQRVEDVGFGLRLSVLRDFLRPLGVRLLSAGSGEALEQQARLVRAREFVAQIRCWR